MSDAIDTSGVGPRASFGVRFLAALIDGVIVGIASGILGRVGAIGSLVGFVGGFAYYIYLEGSPSGQTIGKRVMNIRVVDADSPGQAIGFGRAAGRYFARFLSGIPCLLGYFWMLWDDNQQTWHDKLATTIVVPTDAFPVEAWPG